MKKILTASLVSLSLIAGTALAEATAQGTTPMPYKKSSQGSAYSASTGGKTYSAGNTASANGKGKTYSAGNTASANGKGKTYSAGNTASANGKGKTYSAGNTAGTSGARALSDNDKTSTVSNQ